MQDRGFYTVEQAADTPDLTPRRLLSVRQGAWRTPCLGEGAVGYLALARSGRARAKRKGKRNMTEAAGGGRAEMERRLVQRSIEDESFRQRLIEDPKGPWSRS